MSDWLAPEELRVGLGCMRLSTDPRVRRDEGRAEETIAAALEAGITVFDTARAYGLDEGELGHNERLLARTIARCAAGTRARIVTKGGMRRPGGRWVPDGRATSLRADCEASLEALGGLPIDLYLLHAPDPVVPLATSVRALAGLLEARLVRRIGLCNVTRAQLEAALAIAPLSAVQVELGWHDRAPLAGGVVALCAERGLTVLAHRPLGGTRRVRSLARDESLAAIGARHSIDAAAAALAALTDLHRGVVALPGASRPQTARACAAAARLRLDGADRARLRERLDRRLVETPRPPAHLSDDGEVVLLMGLQGAGKTERVAEWVARGYERFNRDETGGTIAGLHARLDRRLGEGIRRAVLDNTYVTRAHRREALETAWRHGLPVRGYWIEVPPAEAQVNVILRMLRAHGRLLEPQELARPPSPGVFPPSGFHRTLRVLVRPSAGEGFAALDVIPFSRRPSPGRPARFVAAEMAGAATADGGAPDVPTLVFAWDPERRGLAESAAARLPGSIAASCPHAAGPPRCWCRPPLPGLLLAFAERHGIDLAASVLVGGTAAHRALARNAGCRFESRGGILGS